MENLNNIENIELDIENSSVNIDSADSLNDVSENELEQELPLDNEAQDSPSDMIEYKEIEEPCVALTIIGENRLTDTEIFVKRGFKFSIKAFFSTLVLTIMNMFI